MKFSLVRAMTRSAMFELINDRCYHAGTTYTVLLDGQIVLEHQETNVFSLFRLLPDHHYCVELRLADGDHGTLEFDTAHESYFVDAGRYGLTPDGEADNTARLQAALSTCPRGGTVFVPAGVYRTQSLFLSSETTLYLDRGCTLLGGIHRKDYPILPGVLPCADEKHEFYLTSWEGNPLDSFASLLNVMHAHDVVITGEGRVDANAPNGDWYEDPKHKVIAWRPRLFFTNNAKNVVLHGLYLCNSYSWTVHPTYSDNIDILHLHIHNHADSPNTDGIDPEACRHVRIIGDYVHVGDDCIALKSSKLFLSVKMRRACEDIEIRNCDLNRGHGGLVLGSEMSGGIRDVKMTQCLMEHTDRGLRVKTRRGRGCAAIIDGLQFRNIEMKNVLTPFVINMFYFCDPDGHSEYVQSRKALPVDDRTPKLGNIKMDNIRATGAECAGCWFSGLPEQPIENVEMRNVTIEFAKDAKAGQAAMQDGSGPVKKLAIWAENVKRIRLNQVKIIGYEGERLQFSHVDSFEEDTDL